MCDLVFGNCGNWCRTQSLYVRVMLNFLFEKIKTRMLLFEVRIWIQENIIISLHFILGLLIFLSVLI